ncbi:MAG: PEP-CTERM sorting domain-containing protein [Bythopirellula sp.]
MRPVVALLATSLFLPVQCLAQPADSMADFSGTQGDNGWFYGIYQQGPVGGPPHGYSAAAFEELDLFDIGTQRWSASDSLVGAQNNNFLNLGDAGGHPTGLEPAPQDSIIWAVRRYVMPSAGIAQIEIDLRKENTGNNRGGGITGRVFVDGAEVYAQLVNNDDGIGFQTVLQESVLVGSTIDFAIDPTGITPLDGSDDIFSARADGSVFAATIEIVPEPSSLVLLFGLLVVGQQQFVCWSRKTQRN